MRLTPSFFLLALAFSGCPSPLLSADAGDAGSSADAGSADGFCERYAAARCDLAARCGRLAPADRSRCEAFEASACWYSGARFVPSGAAAYDADAGESCLREVASQTSCVDFGCTGFTLGGGPGQPCAFGLYCREGFCRGGAANTCAACAAYVALGQPCSPTAQCDRLSAFCESSTGLCIARKQTGALCSLPGTQEECAGFEHCFAVGATSRCGPQNDGEPCGPGGTCRPQSYCAVTNPTTGEGQCAQTLAAGSPCQLGTPGCRDGTGCLYGLCTAPAGNRAVDAGCLSDAFCQAGLKCTTDTMNQSTCQLPGTLGMRCNGGAETCVEGLTCACMQTPCVDFTCQPRSGAGEPCPCLEGNICSQTDGGRLTCVRRPELGEPCQSVAECLLTQFCSSANRCEVLGAPGAPCRSPIDCESYVCQDDGGCATVCF